MTLTSLSNSALVERMHNVSIRYWKEQTTYATVEEVKAEIMRRLEPHKHINAPVAIPQWLATAIEEVRKDQPEYVLLKIDEYKRKMVPDSAPDNHPWNALYRFMDYNPVVYYQALIDGYTVLCNGCFTYGTPKCEACKQSHSMGTQNVGLTVTLNTDQWAEVLHAFDVAADEGQVSKLGGQTHQTIVTALGALGYTVDFNGNVVSVSDDVLQAGVRTNHQQ